MSKSRVPARAGSKLDSGFRSASQLDFIELLGMALWVSATDNRLLKDIAVIIFEDMN